MSDLMNLNVVYNTLEKTIENPLLFFAYIGI